MRTLKLITCIIMITASYSFAQEGGDKEDTHSKYEKMSPDQRANKRTDKMTEILGLDEEQEKQIREINNKHAEEMDKIHKEMKALKEKAKNLRDQTKTNIDEVLSDEQKEKFEQEREKHKEERKKKRKERCCEGN